MLLYNLYRIKAFGDSRGCAGNHSIAAPAEQTFERWFTVGVLLAGMGLLTWDMIVTCIQFNSREIANISVDTSYLLFVIIYYLLT